MPDILIRGMEMPQSCSDCPMCYDMIECTVSPLRFWHGRPENEQFDFCNERHPVCPLHELPEHGDLISKPALFDEVFKVWGVEYAESDCNMLMDLINDAPVIVPADKEETE